MALALVFVAGGCALLDRDPTRVTMAELWTGAYDPEQVEGVDVSEFGVVADGPVTFCEAAATTPLRWTVDALVPMQVWVDTYTAVIDMPEDVVPSSQHLVDLTQRRLRWSLTGQGERPTWDAETVAAAETLIDVAIASCPDLPMVVGLPGASDRPPGWSDMSDAAVADHCGSMASRLEEGLVEYQSDHGRPPRHHMELDLPIEYYGASDFHGIVAGTDGMPIVVPVPGGACDLA